MPSKFLSDTGENVGNSPGADGRGRIHTKVSNAISEPIPVFVVEPPPVTTQNVVIAYNGVTSVASSSLTPVLTYTVPPAMMFYIGRVEFSGTDIAQFRILINGIVMGIKRTYFGGELNGTFEFSLPTGMGVTMVAGDVLVLDVEHQRPMLGDFDATLVGLTVS